MKEIMSGFSGEKSLREKNKERYLALWELQNPIEIILSKLREEIESGDYGFIVGDDASGRIPALIVGEVLGGIYKDKGLKAPLIRFIAGSTGLHFYGESFESQKKKSAVSAHIRRIKEEAAQKGIMGGKALIVTDTVASGESIKFLLDSLKRNGIGADVATIGVSGLSADPEYRESIEKAHGTKIIYGGIGTPQIYWNYDKERISGVAKNKIDLFSKPLRTGSLYKKITAEDQRETNAARETTHEIADEIIKNYRKNSPD